MRYSNNQEFYGVVKNGFDYTRQCWIRNFIVLRCGHKEDLNCSCYGRKNEGRDIRDLV